ncbi:MULTISPECIES: type II toxin-antitoxin system RelE/ParE family toxin [Methyloversatilis]|jgi:plasmid stabilization system protein ParE|uniref:type II toxin-antitoxin system RelE/ParE family toxin n=1 Tax=Methyloversatilis TaxID=378210 RepID=UPI00045EC1D0|nr:type II toxin-antitoxin system RelE/ParE family toxin [Methyloversatilis discipulorum]
MTLRWTRAALGDLQRLHAFLRPVNPEAAARVIQRLSAGPDLLQTQPRIGTKLPEFEPREVRYILIGDYELRYEITADQTVWILRVWHTREFR